MPRTARSTEAGTVYHVLNRGNGRMRLFHKDGDYAAFERVLAEGLERYAVELLTYCVMPNHWHLVVRPNTDQSLGHWMPTFTKSPGVPILPNPAHESFGLDKHLYRNVMPLAGREDRQGKMAAVVDNPPHKHRHTNQDLHITALLL